MMDLGRNRKHPTSATTSRGPGGYSSYRLEARGTARTLGRRLCLHLHWRATWTPALPYPDLNFAFETTGSMIMPRCQAYAKSSSEISSTACAYTGMWYSWYKAVDAVDAVVPFGNSCQDRRIRDTGHLSGDICCSRSWSNPKIALNQPAYRLFRPQHR